MRLDYPMKKNGMYLLKKTDFEDIACQVLTEYMPSVFNYPRPTDIEYLAQECLYLDNAGWKGVGDDGFCRCRV